jgi:hypothetical protein
VLTGVATCKRKCAAICSFAQERARMEGKEGDMVS